jgi:hypothetical protein
MGVQAPFGGAYPVTVSVTGERELNRLWGIPFLGMAARAILAIPHLLVLWLIGIGIYIWILLGWIPILLFGKVPDMAVSLIREYLQRYNRVGGYVLLLPSEYPPLETGPSNPVMVQMAIDDTSINRLWGIPFIGIFARVLVLIPHMIVLMILGIVMYVIVLVVWIPILINGRYPDIAVTFLKMFMAYSSRVTAYAMLLPVPYPPFSFD